MAVDSAQRRVSRVPLLGDSHLARIRGVHLRALREAVAVPMINAAAGGATSADLRAQVRGIAFEVSAAVVSVGTNDAAPWKAVRLDDFGTNLLQSLDLLSCPAVLLTPPPVDEQRLENRPNERTNAVMATYAARVMAIAAERGCHVVDTAAVLHAVGEDWHDSDGLHINAVGYQALVPAIAEALRAAVAARPAAG